MEALNEEDVFEDDEDVEMLDVEEGELVEHLDVEEGELVEHGSRDGLDQCNGGDSNVTEQECLSKNQRRRANKKKNKRKRNGLPPGPNVTDINR